MTDYDLCKPQIRATWQILGNGDVREDVDGMLGFTIYHTGDAEIARQLIAERRAAIEKVFLRFAL